MFENESTKINICGIHPLGSHNFKWLQGNNIANEFGVSETETYDLDFCENKPSPTGGRETAPEGHVPLGGPLCV